MSAIIEAIRKNDLSFLEKAISRDRRLARKPQLILEASRWAWLEGLKLLAACGASLDASWRGYCPIHALIQERVHGETDDPPPQRLRCLEWLLENGADPEQLGAWPPARAFLVAAFEGTPEYIELLLRYGARHDDIFTACALGKLDQVKRHLKKEPHLTVERDSGGLTALQCAAASKMGRRDRKIAENLLEIATLMLDSGADTNAKTKSWSHEVDACYFAVSAGNSEMLKLLLDRGADPNSALVSSAWRQEDQFCEICLRHGADYDAAAIDGRPLLNEMVRWGQMRRALWLLEKGADPNIADERGWTAVHQAASRGNVRMLKAILQAGGDSRRKDKAGQTPLQVAKAKTRDCLKKSVSQPGS